jgi:hypothetical protein
VTSIDRLYSDLISIKKTIFVSCGFYLFLLPVTTRFGVHFICTRADFFCLFLSARFTPLRFALLVHKPKQTSVSA